jgi:hypothetical protein
MQIDFTDAESTLLLELLREHHKDMLMEISRTDSTDYKNDLKQRYDVFESLIAKLESIRSGQASQQR